jgi:hypothetical protein
MLLGLMPARCMLSSRRKALHDFLLALAFASSASLLALQ